MTEWLKSFCFNPLKYGLEKLNLVAVKSITAIFNLYGSRLFKMNDDHFIKANETTDNYNVFYLIPLNLKEKKQNIGQNCIELTDGIINDMVINVPWKEMLKEATKINISSVSLKIFLSKKENDDKLIELENSYLSEKENIENNYLIDTYRDIGDLLCKYFNKIHLHIKSIDLCFNNLDLTLKNVTYSDNKLLIEEIEIFHLNQFLGKINGLSYQNSSLSIDMIKIDSILINHLPEFYLDDSGNNMNIKINIKTLKFNDIDIKNLSIDINENNLIIMNLESIDVNQLIHFETLDENFLTLSFIDNSCQLNSDFILKMGRLTETLKWIDSLKEIYNSLNSKLISTKINVPSDLTIHNVFGTLIYGDDIFYPKIQIIRIGENIELFDTNIKYRETVGNLNISINQNVINLTNVKINSNNFKAESFSISIINKEDLLIIFDSTQIDHILPMIDVISQIIKIFVEPSEEESLVNFEIRRSSVCFMYSNLRFDVIIHNGFISLNTKTASTLKMNILIDKTLIFKITADVLSEKNIKINKMKMFIDPIIFDKLNALLGIFKDEEIVEYTIEAYEEITETLSKSYMFKDLNDFEETLNSEIKDIHESFSLDKTSFFPKPFINLANILVNNYLDNSNIDVDFYLSIDQLIIKLFNDMSGDAFLYLTINDINLNKKIKKIKSKNEETFNIKVGSGEIIDIHASGTWQNFLKFSDSIMNTTIVIIGDSIKVDCNVSSFQSNIREETLLRLLAFFSNSLNNNSKGMYIEEFRINSMEISISYYPISLKKIVSSDILALTNFKIKLSPIYLSNIDNVDKLIENLKEQWNSDINLNNVLQFIPNIKIIHKHVVPFSYLMNILKSYFSSSYNKRKIRYFTKKGKSMVDKLIKSGINHVWQLFN